MQCITWVRELRLLLLQLAGSSAFETHTYFRCFLQYGIRVSQKAVSLSDHVLFKETPVLCCLSQLIKIQSCQML